MTWILQLILVISLSLISGGAPAQGEEKCSLEAPWLRKSTALYLSNQLIPEYISYSEVSDKSNALVLQLYLWKVWNEPTSGKHATLDASKLVRRESSAINALLWLFMTDKHREDKAISGVDDASIARQLNEWYETLSKNDPKRAALMRFSLSDRSGEQVPADVAFRYLPENDREMLWVLGADAHRKGDLKTAYRRFQSAVEQGEPRAYLALSLLTREMDSNCDALANILFRAYRVSLGDK